ncbi:MAG: S8 family serine peptidase [Rubrobacteraceae bacterium]
MESCRSPFSILLGATLAALLLLGTSSNAWGQNTNDVAENKGPAPKSSEPLERRVDESPKGDPYRAGELIVTYKPNTSERKERSVVGKVNGKTLDKSSDIEARFVAVPKVKAMGSERRRERTLLKQKKKLQRDPRVEAVDFNYLVRPDAIPNDPRFVSGDQWGLSRIEAPEAWDTATGRGASIAVMDSGIDLNHRDLRGKVTYDWDFIYNDPVAEDWHGHGTHVAGIAAAVTDNGSGIAGTAPDAKLQIAKTGGSWSVMEAIDWATLSPAAQVINMSFRLSCSPIESLEDKIEEAWDKGTLVVASAGNRGRRDNCAQYPAAAPRVLAVASTTESNRHSSFSTHNRHVDVAAPGSYILSTYPGNRYRYMSGTSMAAPHAAGVAALLASQGLSPQQIQDRMESTATDLGRPGRDDYFGHGLIDAEAAVGR